MISSSESKESNFHEIESASGFESWVRKKIVLIRVFVVKLMFPLKMQERKSAKIGKMQERKNSIL